VFPLPKTLIDESEGSSSLVLSDFELVEGGSGRRGGGGGGCGVESAALVVGLIAGRRGEIVGAVGVLEGGGGGGVAMGLFSGLLDFCIW